MEIPKKFKLFGQTVEVEYSNKLICEVDAVGHALLRENKIKLQSNTDGVPRSKEMIEQTFLHELCHWMLYLLKEDDLYKNEKFVDNLSNMLHQFMITSEGKLK